MHMDLIRRFLLLKVGKGGGEIPNDHYCWERPEDLDGFDDTHRSTIPVSSGSDLAGEMAAALAAASIVFKDQPKYAMELLTGAEALYAFAKMNPSLYVNNINFPLPERTLYNSTSFTDELIWGSTWLYFATGNSTYLGDATIRASDNSILGGANIYAVFDWDSKLVGAQVSLNFSCYFWWSRILIYRCQNLEILVSASLVVKCLVDSSRDSRFLTIRKLVLSSLRIYAF